jgi:hypothetical protein
MPMALSVALAIRDAVPGGPTSLDMQVKTGSVTVADEVTPDDEVRPSLSFTPLVPLPSPFSLSPEYKLSDVPSHGKI